LLDIVLDIESYEREIDADGLDIECDWPEPDEGCEWPTLVGTADEKAKLHELCMEFKDVFGACPVGGSKLSAMDITLKKNADGSDYATSSITCAAHGSVDSAYLGTMLRSGSRTAGTSVVADGLIHQLLPPSSRTRGRMLGASVLTIVK
jgi:hypothetical protein